MDTQRHGHKDIEKWTHGDMQLKYSGILTFYENNPTGSGKCKPR
jgi:hypothetical protein